MSSVGRIKWNNLEDQRRYQTIFDNLLAEGSMVGRDIAVTCSRTGARKSIFTGADVAANTADEHIETGSGLYLYSSMNGATNLVDTDLSDGVAWAPAATGDDVPSVSDQGNGIYRIVFNNPVSVGVVRADFTTGFTDRIANMQIRLISGSFLDDGNNYIAFRDGTTPVATLTRLATVGSVWTDIETTTTTASDTDNLTFKCQGSTATIEVRYIRAVDSTFAVAPFPDASAAGASYNEDVLSCSPSWGTEGAVFFHYEKYADNANFQRLFTATDIILYLNLSGNYLQYQLGSTILNIAGTTQINDGVKHYGMVSWDSTNMYGRLDSIAETSTAEATNPSGTEYVGNRAGGGQVAHGTVHLLHFNRKPTDLEYEILRSGYSGRLSGVTTV